MNTISDGAKHSHNNDTKLRLMQTVSELICESNYGSVGIAEICEKAGVSKGAFYHHFYSKVDFFASACAHEWKQLRQLMEESLSPHYTALQQLQNIIQLILYKQHRKVDGGIRLCGNPFFIAGAQAGYKEIEVRAVAKEMSEKETVYFAALVRNLATEGYLQLIDAQQMARLLQQFIQGVLVHGQVYQDLETLRIDLCEGIYRLLGLNASSCDQMHTSHEIK